MTGILTAAQMRAIEQEAIASGRATGLELMERAGRGVVEAVFEEWPELRATSHRAVVLCGPGNNGGDGFVVARLLKEWGWEVEVFLYGDPEKLPPDARVNHERWLEMGRCQAWDALDAERKQAALFVDAVFGTGITRPLPESVARELVKATLHDKLRTRVVAVDMPSGLCADSGKILGDVAGFCDLTVTFHAAKLGHVLGRACLHVGRLVTKDIGLTQDDDEARVRLVDRDRLSGDCLPHVGKWVFDHKYSHGHAMILSGGPGQGGAARLAARGALRIGAGLVKVGVSHDALAENAAHLTAVMLAEIGDADALIRILEDSRITALCLGPGLGTGAREAGLVAAALGALAAPPPPSPPHEGEGGREGPASRADEDSTALPSPLVGEGEGGGAPRDRRRGVVLDADALTILARAPELFAALHDRCVLTPHAGEFARLFPDIAAKLAAPATTGPAYSKVDATRAAAARAGCVVLFKGPDTVIAAPDGRCSLHSAHYDRAAPWLATAGSGDVLAGFIAGLLARSFDPMQAAETAAWLHAECALSFGPGLIAEDLPEELPKVFRALGL